MNMTNRFKTIENPNWSSILLIHRVDLKPRGEWHVHDEVAMLYKLSKTPIFLFPLLKNLLANLCNPALSGIPEIWFGRGSWSPRGFSDIWEGPPPRSSSWSDRSLSPIRWRATPSIVDVFGGILRCFWTCSTSFECQTLHNVRIFWEKSVGETQDLSSLNSFRSDPGVSHPLRVSKCAVGGSEMGRLGTLQYLQFAHIHCQSTMNLTTYFHFHCVNVWDLVDSWHESEIKSWQSHFLLSMMLHWTLCLDRLDSIPVATDEFKSSILSFQFRVNIDLRLAIHRFTPSSCCYERGLHLRSAGTLCSLARYLMHMHMYRNLFI